MLAQQRVFFPLSHLAARKIKLFMLPHPIYPDASSELREKAGSIDIFMICPHLQNEKEIFNIHLEENRDLIV